MRTCMWLACFEHNSCAGWIHFTIFFLSLHRMREKIVIVSQRELHNEGVVPFKCCKFIGFYRILLLLRVLPSFFFFVNFPCKSFSKANSINSVLWAIENVARHRIFLLTLWTITMIIIIVMNAQSSYEQNTNTENLWNDVVAMVLL